MEENYEWISLKAYDPYVVVEEENRQSHMLEKTEEDELCDLLDTSDLYFLEEEIPFSKLIYFIVHNHERKINGETVSLKQEKIGCILLLQTKEGPLELRFGLSKKARGKFYLPYALEQLKEKIRGNETVLDSHKEVRSIEKEMANTHMFFKLPSHHSLLNQYLYESMEKIMGPTFEERKYLYEEGNIYYGFHGSIESTLDILKRGSLLKPIPKRSQNQLRSHIKFYQSTFSQNASLSKIIKNGRKVKMESTERSKELVLLPPQVLFYTKKDKSFV